MLQAAHERLRSGPNGKTMSSLSTSASMLGPWPVGGKVNVISVPKIDGYALRIASLSMVWTTSVSTRKITVSLQARTDTPIVGPPRAKPSDSTAVNGQGPAIQETL